MLQDSTFLESILPAKSCRDAWSGSQLLARGQMNMEGEEKLCVKHCCRFWGQSCDEKFPASTELHSSMEYIFSGTKIFVFAAQIIPFPVYMF